MPLEHEESQVPQICHGGYYLISVTKLQNFVEIDWEMMSQ